MNGLKLRHLNIVLAISQARSLAQAAERLYITPAAISKALTEAEAVFSQPLFERGRGWIRPTALGELVISAGQQVQAQLSVLSEDAQGLGQGHFGELRIGVKAVSLHPFLADTIAEFSRQFPRVRLRIVEGESADLRDMLIEGQLSLLFARLSADITKAGLASAAVTTDTVAIVASADHPLALQRKVCWEELVAHQWCLPAPGTLMRDLLTRTLAAQQLDLPTRYVETSDMTLVAPLLGLGHYLTIVPTRVAQRFLAPPVGCVLPIEVPPAGDAVGLIWNRILPMSATAQHFLDLALMRLRSQNA